MYNFKVISYGIDEPSFCANLNVTVDSTPITIEFKEARAIREGSEVEYRITIKEELTSSYQISKINGVDVEESEKYDYTGSVIMDSAKTIEVTFL